MSTAARIFPPCFIARKIRSNAAMADTLKAQHTAHLTRGHALYTDMGRVIASITADTLGWHDPLGGVGDARLFAHKYGTTS